MSALDHFAELVRARTIPSDGAGAEQLVRALSVPEDRLINRAPGG